MAALTARGRGLDCFQPQPRQPVLRAKQTLRIFTASAQARKPAKATHVVFLLARHEVGYFVGTPAMAGQLVCPNRLGGMMQPARAAHGAFRRSHGSEVAACFDEVVARAVRVSQPAVLSALLAIQLFGIMSSHPPFPLKSTKRSAAAISRPQRSFITFHGALRNILLSAGFPAMFHMIALEQMFVNNLSQKIFLADAASESNRFYQ